jgi:adenosine deaminase
LVSVSHAAGFDRRQVVRLVRNAIEIAWMDGGDRNRYLQALDAYAGG